MGPASGEALGETMRLGVDEVDGRPLYQYRVSLHSSGLDDLNSIEMWELMIGNPKSRDDQVIRFLAPVAAARFASNYEDGVPSWDHCGEAVSNLRKRNLQRFSYLLERSLALYHVPPLRLRGGDTGWLETVIGQAGLPAGMLRPGKVIRSVLDQLMAHLAAGEEGLSGLANELINEAVNENKLRTAYRDAGHLPDLCEKLVRAVVGLTAEAGWSGGELDSVWAIPSWEESLPFRVDPQAAREIVTQLLKVAIRAAGGGDTGIARVLSRSGTEWKLKTRASVSAEGVDLAALGLDALPPVAAVFYTVNGQPVEEAFRIRQKEAASYRLHRGPNDLIGGHGAWDVPISLALSHEGRYLSIPSSGGDALDSESAWVFEPRNGEYVFKAPAPVRLRAREILVAVEEGTRVTGAVERQPDAYLATGTSDAKRRELWKVSGRAAIERDGQEAAWVEAGFEGTQSYLDFKGKPPSNFQAEGYASVFIGNPNPRRVGCLTGRIQWRRQGENVWHDWTHRFESGLLAFRLVDEAGDSIAERRRVLVFPEGFRPEVSRKGVSLRLPTGFGLSGKVKSSEDQHTVEFGQASMLGIDVSVYGTSVRLNFTKPAAGAFIDLLTREQTTSGRKVISSWAIERMCAISGQQGRTLEVSRTGDRNAYPIPMNDDGRRNLFDLKSYLQALAFHPRLKRHSVLLEFQNAAALQIDSFMSRIHREGMSLIVQDASPDMEVELMSLASTESEQHETLVPERVGNDIWIIPDLSDQAPLYLAVDKTRQALPCLVVGRTTLEQAADSFLGAVCLRDEAQREAALTGVYERIVGNPFDAKSIDELRTCLRWVTDFQLFLEWLSPFLILASQPGLAMKILALAGVAKQEEAASALREALDRVPFFWHRVTPLVLTDLMGWTQDKLGPQYIPAFLVMLEKREISRSLVLPSPARSERSFRDWEEAITNFRWVTPRERKQRSPAMASFVSAQLWGNGSLSAASRIALKVQPKSISTQTNVAETYYLAPQELAVAHALKVELTDIQMADFIYARYVIDPVKFDAAYSAAISVLEN